jgi:hypothetical protein
MAKDKPKKKGFSVKDLNPFRTTGQAIQKANTKHQKATAAKGKARPSGGASGRPGETAGTRGTGTRYHAAGPYAAPKKPTKGQRAAQAVGAGVARGAGAVAKRAPKKRK